MAFLAHLARRYRNVAIEMPLNLGWVRNTHTRARNRETLGNTWETIGEQLGNAWLPLLMPPKMMEQLGNVDNVTQDDGNGHPISPLKLNAYKGCWDTTTGATEATIETKRLGATRRVPCHASMETKWLWATRRVPWHAVFDMF